MSELTEQLAQWLLPAASIICVVTSLLALVGAHHAAHYHKYDRLAVWCTTSIVFAILAAGFKS